MIKIKYFDSYIKQGMKIIPVYHKTKIPIGKNWNAKDYDVIKNRNYIENHNCNMGLLLGEYVDIEGDTEAANNLLNELIGDLPHPIYRSSKSSHHIFKNPNGIIQSCRFNDLEFRSYGTQSVVPPSIHNDGAEYMWLKGTKFPAPELPDNLLNYYLANTKDRFLKPKNKAKPKKEIKKGFKKSLCNCCKRFELIHKKRLVLETLAFKKYGQKWSCHRCRKVDVREDCRLIRKAIEV